VAIAVGHEKPDVEITAGVCISVPTGKTHVLRVLARPGRNNRVRGTLLGHDADPAIEEHGPPGGDVR
jgi:hypothetical protein